MLLKLLNKELENGVAPGVTASEMTGIDRNGNMYADWQPSNRFFLPEEVAEVVLFYFLMFLTAFQVRLLHVIKEDISHVGNK